MTIPLTGTGGLFTRLGKLGKILFDINSYQKTTLPTDVNGLAANFSGSDLAMIDGLQNQMASNQQAVGGLMNSLQTIAANVVNTMVYQDSPQSSKTSLAVSLAYLINQMKANGQSVQSSTATATVTPGASNSGNGALVVSCQDASGNTLEDQFAETVSVTCSTDSSANPSSAGNETFQVAGQVAASGPFDWLWPLGSGTTSTITCVNATNSNTTGTLLTNGDFESFTSNAPNNWAIVTGTAGTNIKQSSSGNAYTGSAALQLVGDGSTLLDLRQQFNSSSGTLGIPAPSTIFAVNCWVKVDVVTAAGVLRLSLVDGSGNIVTDANGNNNSITLNLHTGAGTSYAPLNGVFRTPHVMPSTLKLRIDVTTAISTGTNLFVDRLGMGSMTRLYQGGPSLAVFSGKTPFYVPDWFSVTTTNSRGGTSDLRTFQTLCDRLLGMKQLGLLLPSSNSPTISDSLIA